MIHSSSTQSCVNEEMVSNPRYSGIVFPHTMFRIHFKRYFPSPFLGVTGFAIPIFPHRLLYMNINHRKLNFHGEIFPLIYL